MSQCPVCGRVQRDWGSEERRVNAKGNKDHYLPDRAEDRAAKYRDFRRNVSCGAVTDIDQIEWRIRDGRFVPVALLELSRVDGNVSVPPTYLQAVLERMTKRDFQGNSAITISTLIGVTVWIVLFRWDLTEFWVYNLNMQQGWWHLDQKKYVEWLKSMG